VAGNWIRDRGRTNCTSGRGRGALASLLALVACLALPAGAEAATASWAFEPASLDLGTLLPGVAATPAHLKLVNTGEVGLSPALVALNAAGEFRLAHNECQFLLGPGGSCEFEVEFTPGSPGPKEATVEVSERNGKVPPAIAHLPGAGVSPVVTVDPPTIDFGTVQAGPQRPVERTATLTNQGPGELFFAEAEYFSGGGPAFGGVLDWSGTTCKARSFLPPGGSCTFTFSFGSLDTATASGELRIKDTAADSPQVIHVSGTVAGPPPFVPPPPGPAIPVVNLTGHPAKRTKARGAIFTFAGNEFTPRFECRLDQQVFHNCPSPYWYRRLKVGRHRFTVRAVGRDGTKTPSVDYSWRVIGPKPKKHRHSGPRRKP
jgi:hypothetical protein